jgi:hypothetical protein
MSIHCQWAGAVSSDHAAATTQVARGAASAGLDMKVFVGCLNAEGAVSDIQAEGTTYMAINVNASVPGKACSC